MKRGSKTRLTALLLLLAVLLTACLTPGEEEQKGKELENRTFTDSSGRQVELPENITRIAPSGSISTMILAAIAPEYFVSIHGAIGEDQAVYLPKELSGLPQTGQLFGGKGNLNKEALLAAEPQLIIDMGDRKDGIREDLDALQQQTNIPIVFIEADLSHLAEAYRTLGNLLADKEERGGQLADFVEETLSMAQSNRAVVPQDQRRSVMYVTGDNGVNTNAAGSTQMQVLDLVGAANAVKLEEISNKGGGSTVSMEQVYQFDPDVILFSTGSYYDTALADPLWTPLRAVAAGEVYEIPDEPYNWLCTPTSVNMLLGVWWLGNLLYPDVYDYSMADKAREIYSILWNYDMSAQEAEAMLERATAK